MTHQAVGKCGQTKQIFSEPYIVGRWYRVRRYGLGPFGEKWWVAPLSRDKITPMGMDEISCHD